MDSTKTDIAFNVADNCKISGNWNFYDSILKITSNRYKINKLL